LGGVIRLDTAYSTFVEMDFKRFLANMLESEPNHINVMSSRSGSTIVNFVIEDPSETKDLNDDSDDLRRLTGNEEVLLLYQWYQSQNKRWESFPYVVLDLKVFARVFTTGLGGAQESAVVALFQSGSDPSFIIPPQPVLKGSVFSNIPGFVQSQTTLAIEVKVGGASSLTLSLGLSLLVVLLSFFLCFN